MKKYITLLLSFVLFTAINANAQIFWTENFESGSTSGLVVDSYTGPNGTWTSTILGAEGAAANLWYVTCAEGGKIAGTCGAPCATGDLGATLHLGSNPSIGGDFGAAYFTGGCTSYTTTYGYTYSIGICAATDKRAESPVINCSTKASITLSYYYIENGQGTQDDGSVWYFNGTSWSLLENPPKTPVCIGGQGQWAHRTIALPPSADHNPNVKIGFRWVNDEDGAGTDPSFAIDSVSLSTPLPVPPVASFTVSPVSAAACQDSCIKFTSTSTGVIDSIRWSMPGAIIAAPHANPDSVCIFPAPGSYTIHLYVYGPGGVDSTTHVVTVKPLPQPKLLHPSGHLLTISGTGYSQYIWSVGIPPTIITGATSSTYTYTVSGVYGVAIDSNGCWGFDTIVVSTVGLPSVNGVENKYWITASGNNAFVLSAAHSLDDGLTVIVYDAAGREVLSDTWSAGTESKQVNSAAFSPGMYTIRLSNRMGSETLKWIKQ